jgi:putative acetyltransferase
VGDRTLMATAHPKLALRPFLPEDAPLLAEIFRAAVAALTAEDYSEAQQEAWASVAEDVDAFGKDLAGQLTLIATMEGSPIGFASLEGKDKIGMLYVHPAVAGQGVGAMLVDALEKLAGSRGVGKLKVDASDSARGFFERRGFVSKTRNTVTVGGEWLANTTMVKPLSAPATGRLQ